MISTTANGSGFAVGLARNGFGLGPTPDGLMAPDHRGSVPPRKAAYSEVCVREPDVWQI